MPSPATSGRGAWTTTPPTCSSSFRAQTLVDLRLGGEKQNFFWSLSVQNVFDVHYYEYAISAIDFFTGLPSFGTYNAYPLPGRTFMAKVGMTY